MKNSLLSLHVYSAHFTGFNVPLFVVEGLTDVILKGDTEHPYNKHRGFVFLDYIDHKSASQAIKKLMNPQTYVFGKNLFADWAEPMAEVSDEIMATVSLDKKCLRMELVMIANVYSGVCRMFVIGLK